MDSGLRQLERAAANDPLARERFIKALQRSAAHPYWIRVREVTCQKDNIYNDEELRRAQPELPRWEERGPSLDRRWVFFLHIPIGDTEMVVWLGQVSYYESITGENFYALLESLGNRYLWDEWVQRAGADANEIARSNWALSEALQSDGGIYTRTHLRATLPANWRPEDIIGPENTTVNEEHHLRPVQLPSRDFLAEEYFFHLFYEWLQNTQTEYGSRLRQACYPLDYRLPTVYQERHIWLHYWVAWDSPREIIAEPRDPHPDRIAYDVAYNVKWCGDYSARFYRWGGQPGDDNSGGHMNALSSCEVVNMDQTESEHLRGYQLARQRAFNALQKKLRAMVEVAEKWRYHVIVEEVFLPYIPPQTRGCPCRLDPYRSTWRAGMRFENKPEF